MTLKNNAYFNEMKGRLHAWGVTRQEREERERKITRENGWNSPELAALKAEAEADSIPYASGAVKAYRAWEKSVSGDGDELEMSDFLWEQEVGDFVETLRKAGIRTFAYTNQSTAVMGNLHAFAAEGCAMDGLCRIRGKESGPIKLEDTLGIRLKLN